MTRSSPEGDWRGIDEQRLSKALVEFAQTLISSFSIQDILDRLVNSVVRVIGVTGAGVVLRGSDEQMHFVAASDDVVLHIEHLQLELGEGPCLLVSETGERVLVGDLRTDRRFERFSPRAAEAGLGAVFSFPLRGEEVSMGALDLYSDSPRELGERQLVASQILADVASVYISNARSRAVAQQSEDQLRHRLLHDPLTGLPNRMLLDDRLKQAAAGSSRSGTSAGVLFLDLDRFKSVNDSFGHHVGDLLLVAVADRIQDILRPGDTLARLAGDEFVVICENLTDPAQAQEVAARIVTALARPFPLETEEVTIGVSIGIAPVDAASGRATEALADADTAMYAAKQGGGGRFRTVNSGLQVTADRRRDVERDLREAIDGDGLHLVYQPIVDAATRGWVGVEALLRWDHPRVGAVSPEAIVAAAARTGLTFALGSWVTRTACRQMRRWIDSGQPRPSTIAVNVSAPELLHPDHCTLVAAALKENELLPETLCLEITESVLVADVRAALNALDALKRLGVTVALDDFGTGYSSLNYLKRFPVSVVKIDRSFITDLADDPVDEAIVVAVIELSHTLGLTVVAEGVESQRQCDHIVALGCDQVQGYLHSRPLPTAAVLAAPEWSAGTKGATAS